MACVGTAGASPSSPTVYSPAQTAQIIQPALDGLQYGQSVVVCQNTVWRLDSQYESGGLTPRSQAALNVGNYYANTTSIYTDGFPPDDRRALFQIVQSQSEAQQGLPPALGTAFNTRGYIVVNGVLYAPNEFQIRNIRVDGGLLTFPSTAADRREGLLDMGGPSSGQILDSVKVTGSRESAAVAVMRDENAYSNGCTNAQVTNNEIRWAGVVDTGNRADGIRLKCASATVQNNFISDVSDVGIAIFGSPGSTVTTNTVETSGGNPTYGGVNNLFFDTIGGISMVDMWGGTPGDCATYDGNMTGLQVVNNTIRGRVGTSVINGQTRYGVGFLRQGIAMGRNMFCEACTTSVWVYGASVTGNTLQGTLGYGYLIDGAYQWTFNNNTWTGATYTGHATNIGTCSSCTNYPPPSAYIVHVSDTNFSTPPDPGYIDACLHNLGVEY